MEWLLQKCAHQSLLLLQATEESQKLQEVSQELSDVQSRTEEAIQRHGHRQSNQALNEVANWPSSLVWRKREILDQLQSEICHLLWQLHRSWEQQAQCKCHFWELYEQRQASTSRAKNKKAIQAFGARQAQGRPLDDAHTHGHWDQATFDLRAIQAERRVLKAHEDYNLA